MSWPERLAINAWTGTEAPTAATGARALGWALGQQFERPVRPLAAPEPVDLRHWWDPRVGWGLVLRDDDDVNERERARGADAPEPLRRLLAARGNAPVLRYRSERHGTLRRHYTDRPAQDIALSGARRGTGVGELPRYLLIYGSPEHIPWRLQFLLHGSAFVGRLDLEGEALKRYVAALIDDWADADVRPEHPVVWASDHGGGDITTLMRGAIATPVARDLAADSDIGDGLRELGGTAARADALVETLAERRPAFVLTTSHGMTGPLDQPESMAAQLGLPVATDESLVTPEALLARWRPDGAIWYAHACCSAGSDVGTRFASLLDVGTVVERTLTAVGALGARVAPLPRALLGAERPLRAFIGQVEPTFDWTLRSPETGQILTASLRQALYARMHRAEPEPIGLAFEHCHRHVGEQLAQWETALREINAGRTEAKANALRAQLAALDWQSLVILGDPTVALPSHRD